MNLAGIPWELKQIPRWICWKDDEVRGKIPIDPNTGNWGSSTNEKTWTTFIKAVEYGHSNNLGIGWVFNSPYIGIDLDDCVLDENLSEFAQWVIKEMSTYTEYSPSQTGLHLIGKGELLKPIKRKEIECYQTGRFFTITGNRVVNTPVRVNNLDLSPILERYPSVNGGERNRPGWVTEELDHLTEGNRNNTFFKVASKLRANGWESNDIISLLKPHAERVAFNLTELEVLSKSASRYAPIAISTEDETEHISNFLENITQVKWLVPPLIPRNGMIFLCGLQETNKTWMLIDLAIEASKGGGYWLQRFPVQDSKVLYIDQERARPETQRRFQALCRTKNIDLKTLDLYIKWGSTIRLDLQHSYDAFKRLLLKIQPDLVLIDSWATFHTKEENNRKDIQEIFERLKILRNEVNTTFVFIDHENKFAYSEDEKNIPTLKTMAGNVAKPAAAEGVLVVRRNEDGSSSVHHMKNTQGIKVNPFIVKVIDLEQEPLKISVKGYDW